tara:strand:- start:13458 stop:14342 length:885 start_codon:yes stop_codon:yes gene_type:complete
MKVKDILGVNPDNKKHRGPRKPRIKGRNLREGGSMPGVGSIHISEIEPTLAKLEKELGLDLRNFTLGSVGKKEFSGDIDIAINLKPEQLDDFGKKLQSAPSIKDMKKSSVFMTSVDIVGYDGNKTKDGIERTGKVQIDFMPGDPGWMKTYYHAPHEKDSKYKGVFRNIMIASIAGRLNVVSSDAKTDDGRPLEQERWMWSPTDGLIRVKRTPVPKKNGEGYTQKNANEIIVGPFKDKNEIAKQLGLDSGEDLYSFETLWSAISKKYPKDLVKAVADDFANNKAVKDIGIPDEIS